MNKKFLAIFCSLLFVFAQVAAASVTLTNPIGYGTFPALFTAITNGVAAIIGGLSTIMVIWAGILFLSSGGSTERMGTAKKALTYAIIGIVVSATAAIIVSTIQGWIGG